MLAQCGGIMVEISIRRNKPMLKLAIFISCWASEDEVREIIFASAASSASIFACSCAFPAHDERQDACVEKINETRIYAFRETRITR